MATPFDNLNLNAMGGGGPFPPFELQGGAPAATPAGAMPQPASPLSFMQEMGGPEKVAAQTAIQKLRPDSDLQRKTLMKLDRMFRFGKDEMKKQYARWNYNEQKIQAYVNIRDYEEICRSFERKDGLPPEPVEVIVPYTYATIHAAATFITSVLLGRKPIFPLLGTRNTEAERARRMEQALQSNLDSSRGFETLWQQIWDSLIYGFGATRLAWETRTGPAIKFINGQRQMVTEQTFAGNVLSAVDPYALAPDPRVPMSQCNVRGDFIFTEMDMSETVLKDMERAGQLTWVKEALEKAKQRNMDSPNSESRRRIKIGVGAGQQIMREPTSMIGFKTLREGTVRLVPKDWGLGDGQSSELWKFTWLANAQIIQAEPLGMIHQQHPYVISEPTGFGHDFMSLSMMDMIGPFQDILSWLVSSRMENVRVSINNQFIADPARVDLNDIRSNAIGRIIRLKQAAMGLPVGEAIQQLMVQDVTQGHLADIQTMRVLADTITGVTDNTRGIQNQGGRRSATEARIAMQAGGSRLSQHAIRISSQAFLPMANQMIMNIQQFMPDAMWIEVTGDDGSPNSMQLTPEMLVGSFNYQVSDGTLPFDKTALVEVWKEILFGVAQDPELRQTYSLPQIFRYVAELGGAKNIDSFKAQPQLPMGAAPAPGQDPNMMPVGQAQPTGPITAQQAAGAFA